MKKHSRNPQKYLSLQPGDVCMSNVADPDESAAWMVVSIERSGTSGAIVWMRIWDGIPDGLALHVEEIKMDYRLEKEEDFWTWLFV